MAYRVVYSMATYVGATMALDMVWNFSDTMNGLMAIPNPICLLWLSKDIADVTFDYEKMYWRLKKQGRKSPAAARKYVLNKIKAKSSENLSLGGLIFVPCR